MNSPRPVEEVDPEFSEMLLWAMRNQTKYPMIRVRDTRVFYTDSGKHVQEVIGDCMPQRNEPCFCGSGKKYKKCCGG